MQPSASLRNTRNQLEHALTLNYVTGLSRLPLTLRCPTACCYDHSFSTSTNQFCSYLNFTAGTKTGGLALAQILFRDMQSRLQWNIVSSHIKDGNASRCICFHLIGEATHSYYNELERQDKGKKI